MQHSAALCLNSKTARRGYTLLEVLIVLGVLTALTMLAGPSIDRLYHDNKLNQAVERVRVKMSAVRIRALDHGIIYQFRFEPDGQRFLVIPYERDTLELQESQQTVFRFAGKLPEDMQFATSAKNDFSSASDIATERIPEELLTGLPESRELEWTSWSPAVLFYPDGTAVDAEFYVVDSKNRSIRLSLRGLTGAVTVSPSERRND